MVTWFVLAAHYFNRPKLTANCCILHLLFSSFLLPHCRAQINSKAQLPRKAIALESFAFRVELSHFRRDVDSIWGRIRRQQHACLLEGLIANRLLHLLFCFWIKCIAGCWPNFPILGFCDMFRRLRQRWPLRYPVTQLGSHPSFVLLAAPKRKGKHDTQGQVERSYDTQKN